MTAAACVLCAAGTYQTGSGLNRMRFVDCLFIPRLRQSAKYFLIENFNLRMRKFRRPTPTQSTCRYYDYDNEASKCEKVGGAVQMSLGSSAGTVLIGEWFEAC